MFAVMKTGGKQYRVQAGDVLRVEKIAAEAGEKVQFNDILMVGTTVGTPMVAGAGVQAEVIDQIKGDKVIHFVKRRRKHGSQRTKGHRQQLTLLRVTDVLEKGADKSGVKAAVGGAGFMVTSEDRFTKNRTDQSEMKKRVKSGEAEEKSAETKAKKAAPKKEAEPKKEAAPKAEEKKAAPKKDTPKAKAGADDLKKLSGVGPALEKKLHAAGVTTFAQIAAWGADDIAKFDEELSFKGRIEREGWVDQAKDLAAGKE